MRAGGSRRRGDRGATLVEYALVLVLLVVASITVAQVVEDETADEVDNQAACLSTRPPPPSCQQAALTPTGGGGPGPSGPGGGGGTPSTEPANITLTAGPTVTPAGTLFRLSLSIDLRDGAVPPQPIPSEVVSAQVTITQSSFPGRVGQFFYVDCATDAVGACTFDVDSRFPDVEQISFDIVGAGIDTNYDFGDLAPAVASRP